MADCIKFVGGIPTRIPTLLTYYDKSILVTTEIGVAGAGYNAAHLVFTLPNGETYDGTIDQLKVGINGFKQVEGIGFNYTVNIAATTITFPSAVPKYARVELWKEK